MILVIGATGFLGTEICRLLVEEGNTVRGIVRKQSDQGKRHFLNGIGVELVSGDLRDPGSYEKLLDGIDVVISTASAMPYSYIAGENNIDMVDRVGIKNFINASMNSGVKHFIYTSLSGNINEEFPLSRAKREVEDHIKSSGIPYTILRCGYFMEVWISGTMGFDAENNLMTCFGNGDNLVSYISLLDVARYVTESILNPVAWNATLKIGGPEKLSQLDVIKIFEETIGHPFQIMKTPVSDLKLIMHEHEDVLEKSMAGLKYCLAKGDPVDMTRILDQFKVKPRTVRDFARNVLAEAHSYDFY